MATKAANKSVAKPSAPMPEAPKKPDPRLRRVRINRIQATTMAQLRKEQEAAAQQDAGTIKTQIAFSNYVSAIVHGDGEAQPVQIMGVEKGVGRNYFLVYRKP